MGTHYQDDSITLLIGDAAEQASTLDAGSVQTVVTSPPYFGLRDYGVDGQLGAESSPAEFVTNLVAVFEAIRPALANDGTLWVNLGDSYVNAGGAGTQGATGQRSSRTFTASGRPPRGDMPPKNLLGIPWRFAFAMQDAGWILRNDIIWAKPNGMPESVRDRFSTKHEHLFLFAKSPQYYFDLDAVRREPGEGRQQSKRALELFREHGLTDAHLAAMRAVGMSDAGKAKEIQTGSGRNAPEIQALANEAKAALGGYYREFLSGGANPGDWWEIASRPFAGAHFATFPPELPERCILAGSRTGDTVLDPFSGSGTTGMVAGKHGRRYVGIDLNPDYHDLALETRLRQGTLNLEGVA